MLNTKKLFLFFLTLMMMTSAKLSYSADATTIKDIRVDGLQRVTNTVVFEELDFDIGDEFNQSLSTNTIRDLYRSGLFDEVDIFYKSNIVYIKVKESPLIGEVTFKGNKVFSEDVLRSVFKAAGLIEGDLFRKQQSDRLLKEIESQYLNEGKYSAEIDLQVSPLTDSKVSLNLIVDEGETATVKKITIIGNEFLGNKEILSSFKTKTSRGLSPFGAANRYSKERLTADIESLVTRYKDAGFADFSINSSRVSITPEKDGVYVTLSIDEGARYKVENFTLNGRLVVSEADLLPLVEIKPQAYYSASDVQTTVKNIVGRLSDDGYSNAKVVPVPTFDSKSELVSFSININPSKTVFVNRIELVGNEKTSSEVIRRELRQVEGAPLSVRDIELSKKRLNRLPYISNAIIDIRPTRKDEEQVDVIVTVTEVSSAQISFGAGYSDADGAILQASYLENNFLGSGKVVDVKVDTSNANKTLRFNYRNPYITKSGVSRSVGLNFNRTDTEENSTSNYLSDTLGFNVGYRFPISEFSFFSIGSTLERIELESTESSAPEILSFIETNPESDQLRFNTRWGFDNRDSFIAPTSGWNNYLDLELASPGSDLSYYKLSANSAYYLPLTDRFTFKLSGQVGLGKGMNETEELPFFKNYFAGGTGTVRGYDSRSLGPKDSSENPDPLGGAKRMVLNASLLTPLPGASKGAGRLGFFVDAAQVFSQDESVELSALRASAGISLNFLTAVGPLAISYAVPLNEEEGDKLDEIQFTIGRFLD